MTELEEANAIAKAIKNVGKVLTSGPKIAANLTKAAVNATKVAANTTATKVQNSEPSARQAQPEQKPNSTPQVLKSKEYQALAKTYQAMYKTAQGYLNKAEGDQQKKISGILTNLNATWVALNKDPIANFSKIDELEKQLNDIKSSTTQKQETIEKRRDFILQHIEEANPIKAIGNKIDAAKTAKNANVKDKDGKEVSGKDVKDQKAQAEAQAEETKALKKKQGKTDKTNAKVAALSGEFIKALTPQIDQILKTIEPLKVSITTLTQQTGQELGKKPGPEFDLTKPEGKQAFNQAVANDETLKKALQVCGVADMKSYFKDLLGVIKQLTDGQKQVSEDSLIRALRLREVDNTQVIDKLYQAVLNAEKKQTDLTSINFIRNYLNQIGDEFKSLDPEMEYDKLRDVLDAYIELLKRTMPEQTSDQLMAKSGGEHEERTPNGTDGQAQQNSVATGDLAKDMTDILKKDVGTTVSNQEIMAALQTAKTMGIKFTK